MISGVVFTNVLHAAFMRAGVNFINIQGAALLSTDPISAIKTNNLTVFFALFGSAYAKAAHILLMKLTPDPKVQKDTDDMTVMFSFWDLCT